MPVFEHDQSRQLLGHGRSVDVEVLGDFWVICEIHWVLKWFEVTVCEEQSIGLVLPGILGPQTPCLKD